MALQKCLKCGHVFDEGEQECPKCNANVEVCQDAKKARRGCLFFLSWPILFFAITIPLAIFLGKAPGGKSQDLERFDNGIQALADENYDEAIELFTIILEQVNLPADKLLLSYYNRGNAWFKKGDYDKAITDYTFALQLDPNHIDSLNNRSDAYKEKGMLPEAMADLNRIIAISPEKIYHEKLSQLQNSIH